MNLEKEKEDNLLLQLRKCVIEQIDLSRDVSNQEIKKIIEGVLTGECSKSYMYNLGIKERLRLSKEIYDSIRGYDILDTLLEDEEITEIMINGPNQIFIEKKGEIQAYNGCFSSTERLRDVISQIVSKANRRVNASSPIVDTRLPDGSRVNVVLDPVAINGPIVTIRKFGKNRMSMQQLKEYGAIDDCAIEILKTFVRSRYSIFVCGGTGSGKTTFLNALSEFIPNDERIITIEDSAELQLTDVIQNLVRMEVKQSNTEGTNGISIRDLIKSSLRMRPDRIVIGEVRGEEAFDLLSAMNTGHDGSLSTGHSNSAVDMLKRLESMILMGMDMPLDAIRGQIASGIDVIVHLSRLRDKSRKVMEIIEITGYEDGKILLNSLYRFEEEQTSERTGKVFGKLKWTGNHIQRVEKLIAAGYREEELIYEKT